MAWTTSANFPHHLCSSPPTRTPGDTSTPSSQAAIPKQRHRRPSRATTGPRARAGRELRRNPPALCPPLIDNRPWSSNACRRPKTLSSDSHTQLSQVRCVFGGRRATPWRHDQCASCVAVYRFPLNWYCICPSSISLFPAWMTISFTHVRCLLANFLRSSHRNLE